MTGLLFLLVIVLVVWSLVRKPTNNSETNTKVYQVNQQWMDYIAAQRNKALDGDQKKILNAMLEDLQQQGMPLPSYYDTTQSSTQPIQSYAIQEKEQEKEQEQEQTYQKIPVNNDWQLPDNPYSQNPNTQVVTDAIQPDYVFPSQPEPVKEPLDNISILLYFSAFLLVVAAGLFVAFGDVAGAIKTFTTAIVTAFLYCFGFWLWYSKPALKQAGLTFIGMGIVIAPLIGVAAYTYTFKQSGNIVWLLTSIACLGLYAHAMIVLKHPLLEYILIGTFVSLFESAVSVIDLPIYYYGWALAFVGLIMQVIQIARKCDFDSTTPSAVSSNVLIPLSLAVSLWMIPENGWTQLGVSLLLGAAFYGTMVLRNVIEERINAAVAAQCMLLAGIAVMSYGVTQSLSEAALSLVIFSVPQILLVLWKDGELIKNVATILLSSLVVASFIAWQQPSIVLISVLTLAVVSVVCWLRQERAGCYQLAVGALIAAVLDVSFRIISGNDMALYASILSLGLLGLQVATLYLVRFSEKDSAIWRSGYQALAITTLLIAVFAAAFTTHTQTILLILTSAILLIPLMILENVSVWSITSSIIFLIPFLSVVTSEKHWFVTVVLSALWNITLIYFYRRESNRGLAVLAMLVLPVAVSRLFFADGNYDFYGIAYFVLATLFLIARWFAIRQLKSEGYGMSYASGFFLSAIASIALSSYAWHWLPAIVCVGVASLLWLSAGFVEKKPVLSVLIPLLLQIGLWIVYQPGNIVVYICVSIGISLLGYIYGAFSRKMRGDIPSFVQVASLILLFSPLLLYFSGNVWWPMPWSFVTAGLVLLQYLYNRGQSYREIAGGVVLLGVWAVMHFYGVYELPYYAHVMTALFAGYAYWRNVRGDKETSDQYFIWVIATLQLGIGLWMAYKPQYIAAFLCVSVVVSLLGYAYGAIGKTIINLSKTYIQKNALIFLFVPLLLYFSGSLWWPLPWILIIAGFTLLHYVFKQKQSYREIAGGVVLLGVWAVMHFYGVRNIQAYSHVLAALFAGYAYWRNLRADKNMSDQYILLTMATMTIPLIIQALVGKAGDIYGWWLLVEQIALMLLGMALNKRLMIRWGLYVALGSVLYQLRNLGWAAVAVLAVFLMSIAIYRLQKHSHDELIDKNEQNNG